MTTPKDAGRDFGSSDGSSSFRDMYRLTGERVEKREDDAIEYEFVRQAAEDALRLLNGCTDSGMRARGFTKGFRSGNATFRLHLQCVERVEDVICGTETAMNIARVKPKISIRELAERAGIDIADIQGEDIDVLTGKRMHND